MKRSLVLRPGHLAAVAALAALAACSKHSAPATTPAPDLPPATVTVFVTGQNRHQTVEPAVGTVRPRLSVTIEAQVGGTISQLPVVLGQTVQKSDLLVEMDAQELRARLAQASATLAQAQADLERFTRLFSQDAVTRAELEAVQTRKEVAAAAVQEAQTLLAYTRITAPFDGVVTRKLVDRGDLALPGKPLLAVEDPSQLRLEVHVPENLLARIQPNASLRVQVQQLTLTGTVGEIAPAADPTSRTFLVKLDLPSHPDLRTGQFGRAEIPLGESASIRIPTSAVLQRGQMEIVFVDNEGRAQLRLVRTGEQFGDQIEIVSGLEPNERVVVDHGTSLIDGQPLQSR